ncbi:MAG: hypothetical protein ACE5OR_03300, partial [bacterium]
PSTSGWRPSQGGGRRYTEPTQTPSGSIRLEGSLSACLSHLFSKNGLTKGAKNVIIGGVTQVEGTLGQRNTNKKACTFKDKLIYLYYEDEIKNLYDNCW